MADGAQPAISLDQLKPGESLLVKWEETEVALFNVEGTLYAIGNRCPHRSGPLVKGKLEKVEGVLAVRCPIHGWLFDLSTGRSLTRTSASVPVFPVTCQERQICLGQEVKPDGV